MCQHKVWEYNSQYENKFKLVKVMAPEKGICETSQKVIPAEGEPMIKSYKLY